MSLRAGFIGLGNQGKPIAANLVPAGFETTVHDLAPGPVAELVAAGAKAAASEVRRMTAPRTTPSNARHWMSSQLAAKLRESPAWASRAQKSES